MTQRLTCRELIEFLDDYLDGELPPERLRVFETHLAACPYCVDYLNSYRATVSLGRRAFEDPDAAVPKEVPEGLVRAILAARRARR